MGARIVAVCFVLAAGWTVVPLAQAVQTHDDKAATTIAVTGCLAKASSAGTAGFVLTKAAPAAVATSAATSGKTPANQDKTPTASQYRLTGSDSMLAPYVDHRVQLTGTVEPSTAAKGANSTASGPTLKVDSVMMLASTCS